MNTPNLPTQILLSIFLSGILMFPSHLFSQVLTKADVSQRLATYVQENHNTVDQAEIDQIRINDHGEQPVITESQARHAILRGRYFQENPDERIIYEYSPDFNQKLKEVGPDLPPSQYNICENGGFEGDVVNGIAQLATWGIGECGEYTNYLSEWYDLPISGFDNEFKIMDKEDMDPYSPVVPVHDGSHSLRINSSTSHVGLPPYPNSLTKPNGGINRYAGHYDVTDLNYIMTFSYALVFDDPHGHINQKPHFYVQAVRSNGNVVDKYCFSSTCQDQILVCQEGSNHTYLDWQCAELDLSDAVGERLLIEFYTADCGQNAHFGYAYLDLVCTSLDCVDPFEEDCCVSESVLFEEDAGNASSTIITPEGYNMLNSPTGGWSDGEFGIATTSFIENNMSIVPNDIEGFVDATDCADNGNVIFVNAVGDSPTEKKMFSLTGEFDGNQTDVFVTAKFRRLRTAFSDNRPRLRIDVFDLQSNQMVYSSPYFSIKELLYNDCGWQEFRSAPFILSQQPSQGLRIDIYVDENVSGNNTFAIDDIGIKNALRVNEDQLDFSLSAKGYIPQTESQIFHTLHSRSITPTPQNCEYGWKVCRLNQDQICENGTFDQAFNGVDGWLNEGHLFNGYGTGNIGKPGRFAIGRTYAVTRIIDCPCMEPKSLTKFISVDQVGLNFTLTEVFPSQIDWDGFEENQGTQGRHARNLLDDNTSNSALSIRPNPTTSEFYVEFISDEIPTHFNVFDSDGKVVLTSSLDKYYLSKGVAISHLAEGIYYFVLYTEENVYTERFVKVN